MYFHHQVKALITDLQDIKKKQLIQLQRLPTLQYKDLLEKKDEIIDDEESHKLICSLGAFRDQRYCIQYHSIKRFCLNGHPPHFANVQ